MSDTAYTPTQPIIPALRNVQERMGSYGEPLIRVTAGLLLMPHGAQKLFGLFGGGDLPECYLVPGTKSINATGIAILDYNGDGGVNLADAVAGLGGLFGGTGPHVLGEDCVEIEGDCEPKCVD